MTKEWLLEMWIVIYILLRLFVTYEFGYSAIPHTKLFGNNRQIVKLVNIIFCGEKMPNFILMLYELVISLASFAGQEVLNKDPTVWLDGAGHANTSISPSFSGNAPVRLH